MHPHDDCGLCNNSTNEEGITWRYGKDADGDEILRIKYAWLTVILWNL